MKKHKFYIERPITVGRLGKIIQLVGNKKRKRAIFFAARDSLYERAIIIIDTRYRHLGCRIIVFSWDKGVRIAYIPIGRTNVEFAAAWKEYLSKLPQTDDAYVYLNRYVKLSESEEISIEEFQKNSGYTSIELWATLIKTAHRAKWSTHKILGAVMGLRTRDVLHVSVNHHQEIFELWLETQIQKIKDSDDPVEMTRQLGLLQIGLTEEPNLEEIIDTVRRVGKNIYDKPHK
ncbi:hypothetical protein KC571_00010 [candidate division WWE3 bacterium]|uniref:Uncharacterized protein n=1 Tax=candidate division WWE3 bacterium TaxID=2053526 RepID=A0A955RPR4_UNCKA|nr:hypothetical protein [candidate division WWE3 bacterium]